MVEATANGGALDTNKDAQVLSYNSSCYHYLIHQLFTTAAAAAAADERTATEPNRFVRWLATPFLVHVAQIARAMDGAELQRTRSLSPVPSFFFYFYRVSEGPQSSVVAGRVFPPAPAPPPPPQGCRQTQSFQVMTCTINPSSWSFSSFFVFLFIIIPLVGRITHESAFTWNNEFFLSLLRGVTEFRFGAGSCRAHRSLAFVGGAYRTQSRPIIEGITVADIVRLIEFRRDRHPAADAASASTGTHSKRGNGKSVKKKRKTSGKRRRRRQADECQGKGRGC